MDWSKISPSDFEKLCGIILTENGFTNVEWYGKAGQDKGRDLKAEKVVEPIQGINEVEKWVVQCKRFISSAPSKKELMDFLNSAIEHEPQSVLIIITNTLSANTKDWFEKAKKDCKFKVYLWEEIALERQVIQWKKNLYEYFPSLYKTGNEVQFYRIDNHEYFIGCDEADEVMFHVVNSSNYDDAVAKVKEFIEIIKQHDVTII